MSNLRKVFRLGTFGVLASLIISTTSCDFNDDNNGQPTSVAYVSIYNAIPDAPELDITVDNRMINPRAFEFGDNTYYQNFYPGQRAFQITPYGANNVVTDTTVTLVDGNAYSFFMVDEYSKAQILITNDSAAVGEEGKVKVRLINLSPDASPVSLKLKDGENTLIENQPFKNASSFLELDPGTFDFEIVSSGGEPSILIPNIDLQSGAVRTIVVRGYRNPPAGNTNAIGAELVRN
ncbi:MAG TPA: DUF4397 domain-containing protein [Chryseolinea sp.]|nr:DUF4397 domain-containing protein [Chryseolinea sp.]